MCTRSDPTRIGWWGKRCRREWNGMKNVLLRDFVCSPVGLRLSASAVHGRAFFSHRLLYINSFCVLEGGSVSSWRNEKLFLAEEKPTKKTRKREERARRVCVCVRAYPRGDSYSPP